MGRMLEFAVIGVWALSIGALENGEGEGVCLFVLRGA